jgi:hypothetical protein
LVSDRNRESFADGNYKNRNRENLVTPSLKNIKCRVNKLFLTENNNVGQAL